MKTCRYCKNHYPESYFGIAKTIGWKVYRRLKCKNCYRETKNKLRSRYRELINERKKKHVCSMCGINDYRVLDFHHIGDKDFGIAEAGYYNYGLARIEKEIAKCVIICANCHRVLHFDERNGA